MKKILILIISAILLFCILAFFKEKTKIIGEEKHDYLAEGTQLYTEGNYENAINSFSMAINESPKYAHAYMHRGETYLAKYTEDINILSLAKADFEKALELDSTLIHAKECIAYILYIEGDIEGAKAIMQQILILDIVPTYTVILFVIDGTYCHECGTFEHTVHPDYIELARNSYTNADYGNAILYFSQRITESPEYAQAYMHRGETYLTKSIDDINILSLAKADFEKALELDSTLTHAKECLAYIFYLQGNSDESRKLILEVLSAINTENSYTLILLIINNKYCHECGRFEHTNHPDVWLTDMSDKELTEMANEYVKLYYDCMWELDRLYKMNPYGIQGDGGYTCFVSRKAKDIHIIQGGYSRTYYGNDYTILGYEYKIGDFYYNSYTKKSEGELYNIKGENITNLFFLDAHWHKYAYKAKNFKSAQDIKNNYRKYFSEKISKEIDKQLEKDLEDSYIIEMDGKIFFTRSIGDGGSYDSGIRYDSGKIVKRSENTFSVEYEHASWEVVPIAESTWSFGIENGKLVLLDYIKKLEKYS